MPDLRSVLHSKGAEAQIRDTDEHKFCEHSSPIWNEIQRALKGNAK